MRKLFLVSLLVFLLSNKIVAQDGHPTLLIYPKVNFSTKIFIGGGLEFRHFTFSDEAAGSGCIKASLPKIYLHSISVGMDAIPGSKLYSPNVGYCIGKIKFKKNEDNAIVFRTVYTIGLHVQVISDFKKYSPSISPEIGMIGTIGKLNFLWINYKLGVNCMFTAKNEFAGIKQVMPGISFALFCAIKSWE
jgi:hypothetical protein